MAEEDTLLREVDEAVRHEELAKLFKRYRKPVLAAAAALIIATAGHGIWQNYADKRGAATMQALADGQAQLTKGDAEAAATTFAAAAQDALNGNAQDMAHLWQGRALIKAGKKDEAVNVLAQLAEHPQGHDAIWRDLACLRLVGLDDSKSACLDSAAKTPLKGQRDLLRAAELWQQGKPQDALALLNALAEDPATGQAARALVERLKAAIEPPRQA